VGSNTAGEPSDDSLTNEGSPNMHQMQSRPMAGKTVLVTGGSSGIGKATALGLATMGAHLAITGRDGERTESAAREIRAAGGGPVGVLVADLSSQTELRRLADEALQRLPRIDVLVNNVGGYWNSRHVTADGLERTFARLTTLRRSSSPTCSSTGWRAVPRPEWSRSRPTRRPWGASNSKTFMVNGTTPASRPTTSPSSPTSCSPTSWPGGFSPYRRLIKLASLQTWCTPGVVSTSFGAEDPATVQRLFIPLLRHLMKAPAQGATSIYVASAPHLERVTGGYFTNSKPKKSSQRSYDEDVAARLWHMSADLVHAAAPRQ
jgi:retinol dehydrogenase 14